jgi:hypothetical protein
LAPHHGCCIPHHNDLLDHNFDEYSEFDESYDGSDDEPYTGVTGAYSTSIASPRTGDYRSSHNTRDFRNSQTRNFNSSSTRDYRNSG